MKLLRVSEASVQLGLKPCTVRQLAKRGLLKFILDWNGERLFRQDDVEDFRRRLFAGELSSIPTFRGRNRERKKAKRRLEA